MATVRRRRSSRAPKAKAQLQILIINRPPMPAAASGQCRGRRAPWETILETCTLKNESSTLTNHSRRRCLEHRTLAFKRCRVNHQSQHLLACRSATLARSGCKQARKRIPSTRTGTPLARVLLIRRPRLASPPSRSTEVCRAMLAPPSPPTAAPTGTPTFPRLPSTCPTSSTRDRTRRLRRRATTRASCRQAG